MARSRNTDRHGSRFTQSKVEAVWEKGRAIRNYDPNEWREDMCGQMIYRWDHGKESQHGWEIDHIRPIAENGSDDLFNLQPLHWRNNRRKADTYPWNC